MITCNASSNCGRTSSLGMRFQSGSSGLYFLVCVHADNSDIVSFTL